MGAERARTSFDAGASAATAALSGPDAKLAIAFASESLELKAVIAGIRDRAPGTPLIGCSTAGEISAGGPGDESVVVAALGGAGFEAKTAAAVGASARLREAGAEAASCIRSLEGDHCTGS